jgi:UDP-2-acetamido-3-amino-2,3-dideoxy-glucuronate N-acetyltransferase
MDLIVRKPILRSQSNSHLRGIVELGAAVGKGTVVWDKAHVRENAQIGANCVIGENVYIGAGVVIADNCKIQNSALIYEPANIDSGVFIGPGAILTNDQYPRAINTDHTLKALDDWEPVGVQIGTGASIGAGAICIAPAKIGAWAVIAAGAVVTKDVMPFSLMVGIPAIRIAWVGKVGRALVHEDKNVFKCPISLTRYQEIDGELIEMSQI